MTATRLARRLGLDRNPLRRRTDKIATCLAAALIAVFLAGHHPSGWRDVRPPA
jgi:hypothetical protein